MEYHAHFLKMAATPLQKLLEGGKHLEVRADASLVVVDGIEFPLDDAGLTSSDFALAWWALSTMPSSASEETAPMVPAARRQTVRFWPAVETARPRVEHLPSKLTRLAGVETAIVGSVAVKDRVILVARQTGRIESMTPVHLLAGHLPVVFMFDGPTVRAKDRDMVNMFLYSSLGCVSLASYEKIRGPHFSFLGKSVASVIGAAPVGDAVGRLHSYLGMNAEPSADQVVDDQFLTELSTVWPMFWPTRGVVGEEAECSWAPTKMSTNKTTVLRMLAFMWYWIVQLAKEQNIRDNDVDLDKMQWPVFFVYEPYTAALERADVVEKTTPTTADTEVLLGMLHGPTGSVTEFLKPTAARFVSNGRVLLGVRANMSSINFCRDHHVTAMPSRKAEQPMYILGLGLDEKIQCLTHDGSDAERKPLTSSFSGSALTPLEPQWTVPVIGSQIGTNSSQKYVVIIYLMTQAIECFVNLVMDTNMAKKEWARQVLTMHAFGRLMPGFAQHIQKAFNESRFVWESTSPPVLADSVTLERALQERAPRMTMVAVERVGQMCNMSPFPFLPWWEPKDTSDLTEQSLDEYQKIPARHKRVLNPITVRLVNKSHLLIRVLESLGLGVCKLTKDIYIVKRPPSDDVIVLVYLLMCAKNNAQSSRENGHERYAAAIRYYTTTIRPGAVVSSKHTIQYNEVVEELNKRGVTVSEPSFKKTRVPKVHNDDDDDNDDAPKRIKRRRGGHRDQPRRRQRKPRDDDCDDDDDDFDGDDDPKQIERRRGGHQERNDQERNEQPRRRSSRRRKHDIEEPESRVENVSPVREPFAWTPMPVTSTMPIPISSTLPMTSTRMTPFLKHPFLPITPFGGAMTPFRPSVVASSLVPPPLMTPSLNVADIFNQVYSSQINPASAKL